MLQMGFCAESHKPWERDVVPMPDPPEEHLRRALLDLQEAHRRYVSGFGRPDAAETAAKDADEARAQAARWGAIARARTKLDE